MEPHGLTGIVTALPEEAADLFRRLAAPGGSSAGSAAGGTLPLIRREVGKLAGRPALVAVTGDGAGNAGRGARALLDRFPVERLVVLGVSGALRPDLGKGRLLVGREIVDPDGERWTCDQEAVDAAIRAAGATPCVLLTTRELAASPEAKRGLRRGSGPAEPDAVDLESTAFVAAAREAGVPWVVLRTVSDAVHESLPSYLEGCRDEDGSVRRAAVAVQAAMRPWTLPALFRLGRRVRRLAGPLADAAERLVAAWVPLSASRDVGTVEESVGSGAAPPVRGHT